MLFLAVRSAQPDLGWAGQWGQAGAVSHASSCPSCVHEVKVSVLCARSLTLPVSLTAAIGRADGF